MSAERVTCAVNLNTNACEAWPGSEPERSLRTRCYRCGGPACRSCSTVRLTHAPRRRIRICADCWESESFGEDR